MTKEEIQIAQAAYCVGKMWDQYEGTENFNEMVGKRVRHLIELVRNHLEQEQPEVDLDNLTIMKEIKKCGCNPNEFDIARHFYELGLNTRKEE